MRALFITLLVAAFAAAGSAAAQEKAAVSGLTLTSQPSLVSPPLSLGGAAERTVLHEGGRFSAGLAPLYRSGLFASPGLRMGGYLAWNGGDYRLDANFQPLSFSGFAAAMGAQAGVLPGELGTSYGLRVGTGIAGERFSVNPAARLGLINQDGAASDVNLVVTVNHAFTPNLSVVGTAEARRASSSPTEGIGSSREVLFGAGIGFRF